MSPEYEPAASMEEAVLNATVGGLKRLLETEELRSADDAEQPEGHGTTFQESLSFYHFQGLLISQLALDLDLRRELGRKMAGVVGRVPAWMEARVYGVEIISARLLALGTAQLMAEHRSAIERIIDDQLEDSESIEAILRESPVPPGASDETSRDIFRALSGVFHAHLQAMVAIARDIDEREEELSEDR